MLSNSLLLSHAYINDEDDYSDRFDDNDDNIYEYMNQEEEEDDDDDDDDVGDREVSRKETYQLIDQDSENMKRGTPGTIKIVREDKECLYGHNVLRDIHNDKKMEWDPNLAYEAEKWAIHNALLDNGASHSTLRDRNGNYYGENLYYDGASSEHKNCHDAIWLWYQYVFTSFYFILRIQTYNAMQK